MGILVGAAKGAEKGVKAGAKGAVKTVKRFPKSSAAGGGYLAGVTHSALASSHPEFYDSTPNKGRSEDKHPYG